MIFHCRILRKRRAFPGRPRLAFPWRVYRRKFWATFRYLAVRGETNDFPLSDLKEEEGPPGLSSSPGLRRDYERRFWVILGPSLATFRYIAAGGKTNDFPLSDLKEEEGLPGPSSSPATLLTFSRAFRYVAVRAKSNDFPLSDFKEEEGLPGPPSPRAPLAGLSKKILGDVPLLSGSWRN